MSNTNIGILGTGVYIPKAMMTAREIAEATGGVWQESAVKEKLGLIHKPIPEDEDGTQAMGVMAARDAIENTGLDPMEIDLVISIGEEWKEYPLTTTGIYIQEQVGAHNAWALDMQQRCCTCVAAMKIAKDIMIADEGISTVLIAGGYRNGDLVDYKDPTSSMFFNLSAGGGAIILKKNLNRNILLGTHLMSDGSLARDAGVEIGGTANPITNENLDMAYKSLKILDPDHMKGRLNEISMSNWLYCIEQAFEKSGVAMEALDYLAVLHFKRSMHQHLLKALSLKEENTIYLEEYGHMGQIDQILSLHLGLQQGKVKDGSIVSMIAAGIGYAWAANVIQWGERR